nr:MAG TPA: hypothetical protein [Caudoviricetes sp.]
MLLILKKSQGNYATYLFISRLVSFSCKSLSTFVFSINSTV